MPSRTVELSLAAASSCALMLLCLGLAAGDVEAESPDAWKTFRTDVEKACLAAAAPMIAKPQIVVDPFGSESYGLAFLNGIAAEGGTPRSLVCIYDKARKRAEIGGAMALETAVPALQPDLEAVADAAPAAAFAPQAGTTAPRHETDQASPAVEAAPPVVAAPQARVAEAQPSRPAASPEPSVAPAMTEAAAALADRFAAAPPAPSPAVPAETAGLLPVERAPERGAGFAGRCDAACSVTLAKLGEADRSVLMDLSAEVARTIAKTAETSLGSGPRAARETAGLVAASADGEGAGGKGADGIAPPTAALAGERSCVLYYYGYSGEASRTVGRHRCAVSEGEGGLVVEKTSGERLHAEIAPLTGKVAAFIGRTYEPGAADTRYDPARPVGAGNDELGNTVGFAAAKPDGGLVLVSSQRRRFDDQGDFFWVLALDPR